jgi:hypothetical protein
MTGSLAAITLLATGAAFAESEGGWEYTVIPMYLWGKSINGESSVGSVVTPLDVEFKDDVLENLEAAFALHLEAKKDDLTLFFEYNYADLNPGAELGLGPLAIDVDVDFRDIMLEFGIGYVFAKTGATEWEILGGARYFEQDLKVKIDTPDLGPGGLPDNISGGDDWWQGLAGLRTTTSLTQNWSLRARVDLGYGGSDNSAIQATGFFNYRFRDWGSFFFGFRYQDIDYDNGNSGPNGYSFKADQAGPMLGVSFHL